MFGHRGTLIEWSSPVKFQPSNGAANPSGCNRVLLETCGAIRAMLKTFANGLTIPLKNSAFIGQFNRLLRPNAHEAADSGTKEQG